MNGHRKPTGEYRSITISRDCGQWYVSVLCKTKIKKLPKTGSKAGIDVGVKRLYTSSNSKYKKPFEASELQTKIKESQTSLNRKRLEKVKVNRVLRKEIKECETVREVLALRLRIKQSSKNYLKENIVSQNFIRS